MDVAGVLAAIGCALGTGAALSTVALHARARGGPGPSVLADPPIGELPKALALWLSIARRLGADGEVPMPPGVRRTLEREICRAGFAGRLGAAEWVRGLLVLVVAASLAAAIAAAWIGPRAAATACALLLLPALGAQSWLSGHAKRRTRELLREFPSALELLVLCLEAGASVGAAMHATAQKTPPGAVRDLFSAAIRHVRSGQGRGEALRRVMSDYDIAPVTGAFTVLLQAEGQGMALGPILRAQASQQVAERFIRAERAALQAPVKLLLPLLTCIFPCTFIVIAVPVAARLVGLEGG